MSSTCVELLPGTSRQCQRLQQIVEVFFDVGAKAPGLCDKYLAWLWKPGALFPGTKNAKHLIEDNCSLAGKQCYVSMFLFRSGLLTLSRPFRGQN